MFSLQDTITWTADEVFIRLKAVLPAGWVIERSLEAGWHRVLLQNAEGEQQWAGEHPDPKILGLDALGWLRLRGHQVQHPAWKLRDTEVSLHRDLGGVSSTAPDPPDLDPTEVEAVYRTTR